VGINLGNINADAAVGATFRLGFDLPADYGPPRIRPSLPGSDFFIPTKELGGYLFTTIGVRAVGRNIFLDGNTFGNSPHVNKEIMVGSLQVGAAITYGEMRLSYSQVYMSKEYTTQQHPEEFGVVTLSCRF
jgi:lipid A 3-O-deacylase